MAEKSQDKIPSLDLLPLQSIDDDLQTVRTARQRLNASYTILGQILAAPSGLSPILKTLLNNARFYFTTALSLIDSHLYLGKSDLDAAGTVKDLMSTIKNSSQAVREAKPEWDIWLKTVNPPEAPAPLPKMGALSPFAAAASFESPPSKSSLDSLSAPTPMATYLVIGGLAAAFLLLWNK